MLCALTSHHQHSDYCIDLPTHNAHPLLGRLASSWSSLSGDCLPLTPGGGIGGRSLFPGVLGGAREGGGGGPKHGGKVG